VDLKLGGKWSEEGPCESRPIPARWHWRLDRLFLGRAEIRILDPNSKAAALIFWMLLLRELAPGTELFFQLGFAQRTFRPKIKLATAIWINPLPNEYVTIAFRFLAHIFCRSFELRHEGLCPELSVAVGWGLSSSRFACVIPSQLPVEKKARRDQDRRLGLEMTHTVTVEHCRHRLLLFFLQR
jgi:hypothetical protein